MADGRKTLTITDYEQDAFYISDKMKLDSYLADQVFASRVANSGYKIKEKMQKDLFGTANAGQTANDANVISGASHRLGLDLTAANANRFQEAIDTLAYLKMAADKANVPEGYRVLFVSPEFEYAINRETSVVTDQNHAFSGIINTGLARGHRFIRNIFGWDLYSSNILPSTSDAALPDVNGDAVACNGAALVGLCTAPATEGTMMGAIRQAPTPEFFRNTTKKRDEWSATAMWGLGVYRTEALFTVPTKV